jgi:uncharacterized protein (DUF885 family)
VREFHEVILLNGSMPLAVLDDVVDRWIEQQQQGAVART